MHSSLFRTALVLGLLSAIGPFSIDMYLPALPQIGADLGAAETQVQMTITLYFLAFGVSQFLWGPMADAWGRKPPLVLGICLFALGSVGCAFAPSLGWLLAARFVQGIGGAAVGVVPRAVIRDRHTGVEATRLMALVMLVIAVSPMLAPLAGSAVLAFGGWRLIFGTLVAVAAMSLLVTLFALPETLAREDRVPVNLRSMARGCRVLLGDPAFLGLTFVGAFGFGSFFVFIASASFVYTEHFGLSPTGFSLAFAFNALGFFAASQAAAPLAQRFGLVRVMRLALGGFAGAALLLLGLAWAGFGTLAVLMGVLFVANAFLGLVMPATFVLALEEHGDIAGLASSLGGTLQMVTGGLLVTLLGPFFDGTPLPMVAGIALCAVLALGIGLLVLRRPLASLATGH
ncbi:multidrug effflux MFS transporter [Rubellimicrobium aerolatum]|uniref:Bcr/CflA family efflux transporter n=1 Tax=Rubellimicrobium aerolatum TaxID=490979 RepID=A0ABW0SBN6_9RHOB|nr:multidrug effflux MFS transporter [Rubellimicrobium aerolatum]MBP1805556.1 DHA1 family bicyclomycin/chloramphenicol resistance-like MFS transporter [Rubellimicrobium aerolatum]